MENDEEFAWPEEWEKAIPAVTRLVVSVCRRRGLSPADVDDMVQVVLVRVVIEAAARKRHFESIPFLCGFCRRFLVSQLGKREKKRSRERNSPDADLSESPAEASQPKDVEDMLFYLSLLVDARHRTVLSLRYVDGLTFSRIGTQLGCAESQAYKLHESALGELRRRLVR